ncbi:hypothetical protein [Halochromatium salexigens]|uniref:Uncharacterized protein n=1 Tax=Halochromatium salexigens TaxID=49447 RepID=A0AAJ0UGZ4_HALSE|nr:hypothetical protein [Halochromatium salexigens]MBK5931294.1 hypothetical protein [Halochromatium salexigens]
MLREFQDLQVHEQRVLRKPRWLWGQSLYLSATRLEDCEWLLIASDAYAAQSLQEYADCWTIGILATLFSRGRKMELIYKNDQIKATLRRLINDYSDICFAVAWIS